MIHQHRVITGKAALTYRATKEILRNTHMLKKYRPCSTPQKYFLLDVE
jgi:hypothetical protein